VLVHSKVVEQARARRFFQSIPSDSTDIFSNKDTKRLPLFLSSHHLLSSISTPSRDVELLINHHKHFLF